MKKYRPDQSREHGQFAYEGGGEGGAKEAEVAKETTPLTFTDVRAGMAEDLAVDPPAIGKPFVVYRAGPAEQTSLAKFAEDQLRDDHGRFAYEGGGKEEPLGPMTEEYKAELREYGKDQPTVTHLDTDEIKGARRLGASMQQTKDIQTPQRERKRARIAKDLYGTGAEQKGHQAWLILGPPAAGKSEKFAEPLAKQHGALIIDADMAKERLPEFDRGRNANAVHEESSDIVNLRVFPRAVRAGDNIVLPLVGKNPASITERIDVLREQGYDVHLILNDLPAEKAAERAVKRFYSKGRFVPPEFVLSIGSKPKETYEKVKHYPGIVEYAHYSNDVPYGEDPRFIERGEAPSRGGSRRRGRARPARSASQAPSGGRRYARVGKLGGFPATPFDDAYAQHIMQQAGIGNWDELARILVEPIGEAATQGVIYGFSDLGMGPGDRAFHLANDDAVQWAAERAAELVGRKRVGPALELVHNAPPWAISEATRDGLRAIVTQAIEEGWSAQELARQVESSWLFDAARASTIARTELGMAHVAGTMAAWRRSGVVAGKRSLMSNLHDQDDICDTNAAVGAIPLDASFPSGDDGPPYHPNCECVLVAEVTDEEGDEEGDEPDEAEKVLRRFNLTRFSR